MPVLTKVISDRVVETIPLSKPRSIIGRDADCDIRLADFAVSPFHAILEVVESPFSDTPDLFILDGGSTFGTFVNEEPLSDRHELLDGDQIQIAHHLFRVRKAARLALEQIA